MENLQNVALRPLLRLVKVNLPSGTAGGLILVRWYTFLSPKNSVARDSRFMFMNFRSPAESSKSMMTPSVFASWLYCSLSSGIFFSLSWYASIAFTLVSSSSLSLASFSSSGDNCRSFPFLAGAGFAGAFLPSAGGTYITLKSTGPAALIFESSVSILFSRMGVFLFLSLISF